MPSVQQVLGTLPHSFREKYPTTYSKIDGSEIFLETPNDLHMQSSTWSQYKHHNTAKFLIACTPNGAILYVSPLYVGLIIYVCLDFSPLCKTNQVCYSYTIASSGLRGIHEWLSLRRARGRSPSGLRKLKPRVCTP